MRKKIILYTKTIILQQKVRNTLISFGRKIITKCYVGKHTKKLTKEKDSKSPREKKRRREKKAPKVQKLQQRKGYMSESTQERKSTDDVPTQHKW